MDIKDDVLKKVKKENFIKNICSDKEDLGMLISLALDVDPKWLMGTSEEMHLSPDEREVLESFGDMETAVLQPRKLNPMEELGMCLALVATDSSVREFVKELMALPSEQRAIALKMLKALR